MDIILNSLEVELRQKISLKFAFRLVVSLLDSIICCFRNENLQKILLDNHPKELRLAFGEELPNQNVIVAFKVAECQINTFLINGSQFMNGFIIALWR